MTIEIAVEINRLQLPYSISNQLIVRPEGKDSEYFQDILAVNRINLTKSMFEKFLTIKKGAKKPPKV
ncbi:MAG: hypothetical protein WCQ26_11760 [Pseudanabaena sp. ELA748]